MDGVAQEFDGKFGEDFLPTSPRTPGIYEYKDDTGLLIYVGKAINLRRRLAQYRNAKLSKGDHKMWRIVRSATSLHLTLCASDKEALLLENERIKEFRPKYNWAGTNFDRYPVLGALRSGPHSAELVCTSKPEEFAKEGFTLYGTFRSRDVTWEAFYSLGDLFSHLGKREMKPHSWYAGMTKSSRKMAFLNIDSIWLAKLDAFMWGRNFEFLKTASQTLLESNSARHQAETIQDALMSLRYFYKREARFLYRARKKLDLGESFVPQNQRDRLFIELKE